MNHSPLRGREIDLSAPARLARGELLLSFDDGPDAITLEVLAALAAHDLRAVFFMIGNSVAAHPEIARAVRAAGHLTGSHTLSHPHMRELSPEQAEAELLGGHALLAEALAPAAPHALFRFPYLELTLELKAMVERHGLRPTGINIDTRDWEEQSPQDLLTRAIAKVGRTGGGIVLMHDVHRRTAEILPAFLNAIRQRGFRVVTPVMSA